MAADKDATTGGEAGGTGVTKKKSCCTPCRAVLICIPVSCLLLGAVFGILVAVLGNPIAWGSPMMSPSTPTSGLQIYSSLDSAASDQEEILHYVMADLGGWLGDGQYFPISLGGMPQATVFILYKPDRATSAQLAANQAMYDTLPAGLRSSLLRYSSDSNDPSVQGNEPPQSSCVCGDGRNTYMTLYYAKAETDRRVKVTVHEWYHVLQMNKCSNGGFGGNLPKWIMEGAATFLESIYSSHYGTDLCAQYAIMGDYCYCDGVCGDDASNCNSCNGPGCDSVGCNACTFPDSSSGTTSSRPDACGLYTLLQRIRETRTAARSSSLGPDGSFGVAQESYSGLTNNYPYSQTAWAYMAHRKGLTYAMKTFLMSGQCEQLASGAQTFNEVFGFTKESFYADFNAWLTSSSPDEEILPTLDEIQAMFSHTTLCSNSCGPNTVDGTCDSTCPFAGGTDCPDCGASSRPEDFPITFSAVELQSNNNDNNNNNNNNNGRQLFTAPSRTRSSRRLHVHADGMQCVFFDIDE